MTWRGVFSGALALIALEAVVHSPKSAGRVGDLLTGVADLVTKAMSPAVALIPDRSAAAIKIPGDGNPGGSSGGGTGGGFSGGSGGGAGGGGSW
jgi:uncharacterized membrane protein YgcG